MVKAAVQGAISLAPGSTRINEVFQRHVTRSLVLTRAVFMAKWTQAVQHRRAVEQFGSGLETVVELGTGWYPVVPLALRLLGAQRVISIDLSPLLSAQRVLSTVQRCLALVRAGALDGVGEDDIVWMERILANGSGKDAQTLLGELGIEVRCADARETGLVRGSVDLFVSNNTFEHIPGDVLGGILGEFRRVGRSGSVMSHFVDMADHYAGFDRSITVFNYLQYSDRQWRLFNNPLQYQNRLRLSDYRALHRASGWSVVDEDLHAEPVEVLRTVSLAPRFQGMSEDDLRVTTAWMTSTPGG